MEGYVNAFPREPRLPINVMDINGEPVPIDCVVDTGFTGFLALPSEIVFDLGLRWIQDTDLMLADGRSVASSLYAATAIWHGASRRVPVHCISGRPALGMSLLWRSDIEIAVRAGGRVLVSEPRG